MKSGRQMVAVPKKDRGMRTQQLRASASVRRSAVRTPRQKRTRLFVCQRRAFDLSIILRLHQLCTPTEQKSLHPGNVRVPIQTHLLTGDLGCHLLPNVVPCPKGGLRLLALDVSHLRPPLLDQALLLLGQLISLARKVLSSDWLPSRLPETLINPLRPPPLLIVQLIGLTCKHWGCGFQNNKDVYQADDFSAEQSRAERWVR